MDFSAPYRGVAYFPIGLDEAADSRGMEDALGVLQAAIDETVDRDMRQDRPTLDALAFLRQRLGARLSPASDFEKALAIQNSGDRREAVEAAFYRLRDVVWSGIEQQ